MQKSNHPPQISKGAGSIKSIYAQNGGTRGHSKPSVGVKQAGPPPPPQPQTPKK
jgi:hypothetical protein